ncbi:MAG: IS5 family transposase [Methyloceanibacter sp.]|uniref:IS5 family transposase n=1 Tax=Methyloceanibacter sp. TaxID=1965321 RepID=UPI003EE0A1C1
MSGQPGLFDLDERYAALSKTGDPLGRLASVVDFEMFRGDLDAALRRSDRARGGRPPMDAVLMFKVLVIQSLYGLADEQTEFQIRDRLSFMRFLGLDLHGRVPDARTIWLFREHLTKAKAVETLFTRFDAHLREQGYLAMGGQMIDASIIAAPRQRNTDAEKDDLKAGRIPEDWTANPAKLRQKDRDGRWTLKRGRRKRRPDGTLMMEIATPIYGYKSHIGADRRHRFIRKWSVTDAARYDGRELAGVLDPTNTASAVWADTAYRSAKNERRIAKAGLVSKVHFRKPPGKQMSEPRRRANAARSRERSGVEHIFADQKHRMALFIRSIGLARARTRIGLANIAYNLRRYLFWENKAAAA